MKRVLFVASVALHINSFHIPYLKLFKEKGYVVDVATQKEAEVQCCDNHFKVAFERNPLKSSNIKAYKQLKMLIDENEYDIIHCHTPVASILTRIAARKARKKGTKIIYTAHGFHFFKGAPKLNWLIYYPIEKLCAHWTDVLITINKEDYALAQKKMKAKHVEYVPGVGINLDKFTASKLSDIERNEARKVLGISENDKMLLSVGELNDNKNHAIILKALQKLPDNIKYCIAGEGTNREKLLSLAKELRVEDRFRLLGRRNDIVELLGCADIFCFPSLREGLPVSLMEAIACGLPVVCSDIRGNVDLISNEEGGFLCKPNDTDAFAENIKVLLTDIDLCDKMRKANMEILKTFSFENVKREISQIYDKTLEQKRSV